MSFQIPPETLAYWQRTGMEPVSDADIALLEQRLGGKAPASYADFMKTYGSVEFAFRIKNGFDYVYRMDDRTEQRSEAISFIKSPEQALKYYDGLRKDPKINMPEHLLPFAMDYGQGELLIEFGQPTERVYYWSFDNHDWETGTTRLGFVADSFTDFINGLKKFDG